MVVYICQCHALDLYHLLLPLLCLQVQSLSLCLYSCPANRLINTIFLDSIYNVFSSVTQSCLTLCDPKDCSMPGLPVLHYLPELAQTHVHGIDDAIPPSHPLSSPSPPIFNLYQPASGSFPISLFFASGGQSIGVKGGNIE